jgi:TPP-dependent indolepyruvate ferredoxin oxidoreductase alpha subunit
MRKPLIGGEDFEGSIGQGEQAQGKDMEAYQRERGVSWVRGREKEEKECVRKRLVLMCEKVLFMKKKCAWKDSMTKPLEFYFK